MSRKKPTGKQKGSGQKKVDWKALEIVHPDAAGTMWRQRTLGGQSRP
jgi:hypothetical protein